MGEVGANCVHKKITFIVWWHDLDGLEYSSYLGGIGKYNCSDETIITSVISMCPGTPYMWWLTIKLRSLINYLVSLCVQLHEWLRFLKGLLSNKRTVILAPGWQLIISPDYIMCIKFVLIVDVCELHSYLINGLNLASEVVMACVTTLLLGYTNFIISLPPT